MTGKYTDRFSEAVSELGDHNAYVCESCGGTDIRKMETGEKKDTGELHAHLKHNASLNIARSEREKVMYSDPAPFGP
ncbi:MAG: hypothetical protein C0616_06570 [Desulfuromonas sp.]|nr:MAG: hypothetical protein C0616_06570 [Desulfuromonas sp.]